MEELKLSIAAPKPRTGKEGFTLAEVLITLAIIGVVAALTIPSVVRNYQKQQTVTRLKKAYSTISNTTNLAIAEYGPVKTWDMKTANEGSSGQGSIYFAQRYLIPYLKVSKDCKNQTTGDCQFKYSTYNKRETASADSQWARFYLNDGSAVAVYSYIGYEDLQKYAHVFIDINGQKEPNIKGRDIFVFLYIVRYDTQTNWTPGMRPYSSSSTREGILADTTFGCNKNVVGTFFGGSSCAALIIKDGWQIKDDYPW